MLLATWRRLAAPVLAVTLCTFAAPAQPAAAFIKVTVNSLGTAEANDGSCTLPEAIKATNVEVASGAAAGECPAGTTGADWIDFAVAGTILATAQLPEIEDDLTIAG